ncbi:MAG: MFS transporter [Microscillaceae bacterium]|nr:MFS transporter [Microscillaceae bacterium]MDW8460141.1 MFS transporter [Cytophagales bacterium]
MEISTKNVRRVLHAWCFYDWANSVHALVIVSTIFPIYWGNIAKGTDGSDMIMFLGQTVKNSALFSYSVSFAFLFVAFINPFFTAIADYTGTKKQFMQFYCYLGSIATAGLFWIDSSNYEIGIILFTVSLIGFSGSLVFYNAYLPEIATEDKFDSLSANGFAYGYAGSVLLLVFSLSMIMLPEVYGFTNKTLPTQLTFLLTGIWWFAFAQYTFAYLPKSAKKISSQTNWIWEGFRELRKVLNELKHLPLLNRFLLAFFFYNMGVQTVMYVATLFGDKELQLPAQNLIITVLILQIIAIVGAAFFAWLSNKVGNTRALGVSIVIWLLICVFAYFVTSGNEFYGLATLVGFVMGGVQALSRSTYSKLMPEDTEDRASYFSFYDFVEKVAIFLGTLVYGVLDQITGSMRNSVIALGLFFIIGLFLLLKIPSKTTYQTRRA